MTDAVRAETNQIIVDEQNPWPGLGAFPEYAEQFFNGRDDEVNELLRRVIQAPLTVLFGKSGLGKTSLLQAGLFPRLRREHILPVYVRIDVSDTSTPLIEQATLALKKEIATSDIDAPEFSDSESLWEYLHRTDLELWDQENWRIIPFLVFDQFEEIFTLGKNNQPAIEQLRNDLADLIGNRIPSSLISKMESGHATEHLSFDHQHTKILFSFREDFLPDFEGWRTDIPALMRNRVRLGPMTKEQAYEAIYRTGGKLIDEEIAWDIVNFVSGAHSKELTPFGSTTLEGKASEDRKNMIEPALLSVLCDGLNKRRQQQKLAKLNKDLLEEKAETIIDSFYLDAVQDLDKSVQAFLGEELITEAGHRKPFAVDDALRAGIQQETLDLLVKRRILRLETRAQIRWAELTHDLITPIVRARRDQHRQLLAEKKQKVERSRQQRLMQQSAETKREQLIRRSNNARAVIILVAITVLLAWVWQQKQLVQANLLAIQAKALIQMEKVEEREVGLKLALAAWHDWPTNEAESILREGVSKFEAIKDGVKMSSGTASLGLRLARYYPESKSTVSVSNNNEIWLGTINQDTLSYSLAKIDSVEEIIAITLDRDEILAIQQDGTLLSWNISAKSRKTIGSIATQGQRIKTASFFRDITDNKLVLVQYEQGVPKVWLLENKNQVPEEQFSFDNNDIKTIKMSPGGRYAISIDIFDEVKSWNKKFQWEKKYNEAASMLTQLHDVFILNETYFITYHQDGTTAVRNRTNGQLIWRLKDNEGAVVGAKISPENNYILTITSNNDLHIWDIRDGKKVLTLFGHYEKPLSADFSVQYDEDDNVSNVRVTTITEDGNIRSYQCDICGSAENLPAIASNLLDYSTELTYQEKERFLKPGFYQSKQKFDFEQLADADEVQFLAVPVLTLISLFYSLYMLRRYRSNAIQAVPESQTRNDWDASYTTISPPHEPVKLEVEIKNIKEVLAEINKKGERCVSIKHGPLKYALVYSIASLGFSAVIGFFLLYTSTNTSLYDIAFIDSSFFMAEFIAVLAMLGWPAVIIFNTVLGKSFLRKAATLIIYFITVIFIVGLTDPVSDVFDVIPGVWFLFMLTTMLLAICLNYRLRSIAPVVLTVLFISVIATMTALSGMENNPGIYLSITRFTSNTPLGDTGAILAFGLIGLFLLAILSWWVYTYIASSYMQKNISDHSLLMDSIMLFFAALMSSAFLLLEIGPVWIPSVIVAFITYKFMVGAGLRVFALNTDITMRENVSLIFMRVSSVGKWAEAFIHAIFNYWCNIGNIQYLAGSRFAKCCVRSYEMLRFFGSKQRREFITRQDILDDKLISMDELPDFDGRFRINDFYYHESFLAPVLISLEQQCSALLLDLRRFGKKDKDSRELLEVFSYLPLDKIIMVINKKTDTTLLKESICSAWEKLPASSVNASMSDPKIQIIKLRRRDELRPKMFLLWLCSKLARMEARDKEQPATN